MRTNTLIALLLAVGCKVGSEDTEPSPYQDSPLRDCDVTLSITPPVQGTTVEVAGRVNNWEAQPLEDTNGDGVFERWLGKLQPGTYGYKLVIDDIWEDVPPDVVTTWDEGTENRALIVADCDTPDLYALSASASSDGSIEASFQFVRPADGTQLDTESVRVDVGGQAVDAEVNLESGTIQVSIQDAQSGKHSIAVNASTIDGIAAPQAFVPIWVEAEPYRWQSGTLYYLFLDRFADGGPDQVDPIPGGQDGTIYMGGDLVGAKQRLDDGWFTDLGVSSIWLSPLNQNPDEVYIGHSGDYFAGYHGYWPTEARGVEDRLGTSDTPSEEALHEFVSAAHEQGIRIVMDVVLNHVHEEHEYLRTHPEWFTDEPCVCTSDPGECNWDSNPLGCWFTDYMPDLDFTEQALVDQMVDDVLWWIETYDIDGLRIDAAKHMNHVILRTLSLRLDQKYESVGGADFWLVGETFTGQGGQGLIMDYVAPYELDGQFDFPLLYPIRNSIGGGYGFEDLATEMAANDNAYGDSIHEMSVFMGNHDVSRYATDITGCDEWSLFGGCVDELAIGSSTEMTDSEWDLVNRLALSYAFVSTQPGVPLLYYGDEIGLAGAGDPDNRRLMQWTDRSLAQDTLLSRIQELGQIRQDLPALQIGERETLLADSEILAFGRHSDDEGTAIVVLSLSSHSQNIPIPTGYGLEGQTLTDALAGQKEVIVDNGTIELEMEAFEYIILTTDD